ncbi:MAG: hypothetical protein ABJD69_02135 [Dokdonia sp.]
MGKIVLNNNRQWKVCVFVLVIMCFTSCVTTYRIKESEFDLVPYKGNEILVFESNQGNIDTITLKKYKGWSRTEKAPYRIFHNRYEKYGIQLIHTNRSVADSTSSFLIEICAFNWKGLRIDVRAQSNYYEYINMTRFTKEEFDSISSQEIRIGKKIYSDVKITPGDTLKNNFREPNLKNQVLQFYWSKKKGLLGWDSKNAIWRLRKKYML